MLRDADGFPTLAPVLLRHAASALLLCLISAAPAAAGTGDRDRDRMPDRWERKNKVSKPRADRDRDGLTNLAEYRAKTNPRRADSDRDRLRDGDELRFGWNPRKRDTDGDGLLDGRENAGTVIAVSGLKVTVKLAVGGRRLTGDLEDASALDCVTPSPEATGTGGGQGDTGGGGDPPGEETVWQPEWGPKPADPDADDNDDADAPQARSAQSPDEWDEQGESAAEAPLDPDLVAPPECQARLRAGALVHEAEFEKDAGRQLLTLLRLVTRQR